MYDRLLFIMLSRFVGILVSSSSGNCKATEIGCERLFCFLIVSVIIPFLYDWHGFADYILFIYLFIYSLRSVEHTA